MAKQTSRGARLTALALATGTLVVAATSRAGAAPVSAPDVFGGEATGTAIHIKINLPVPVTIPTLGQVTSLTQDISFTQGNTAKGIAPRPVSVAKAVLGNGDIAVVSNLLARTATASLDGQHSASNSLAQDINLGLIQAKLGHISSSVTPESATSTLTSTSAASLAELSVGLGSLADSLPVKAGLDAVTEKLQEAVAEDGTLTTTITEAVKVLDQAVPGASQTVAEQISVVRTTLVDLLEQLSTTIGDLTSDTDLVRLSLLKSTSDITRVGDTVTAKATSTVGGLNILGGLVTVDAAKTTSQSSANGVRGKAAASSSTSVADIRVGDVLELSLGTGGLTGKLLGNDLPTQVNDTLQTVLSTINSVLATAGVEILNGKETSSVDPNGQFASSSSDGMIIVVNPLKSLYPTAKPLVVVQMVPAGTAVNAAHFAKRTPPKVAPPSVRTPSDPPLAHTGAELPLFAVIGTGLAALALAARRRRTVRV